MQLIDVVKKFPTQETCEDYLAVLRWPNGIVCQKNSCGVIGNENFRKFTTNETTRMRFSKRKGKMVEVKVPSRNLYECKLCGYQFSVTTGTVFHSTHLPLEKWFQAVALVVDAKKGMSALQICRHLGLPVPKGKKIPNAYQSIWYLCHRIREGMNQDDLVLDAPEVEVDETYVGSHIKRPRHARPKIKQDDVVLGMVERNGGRLKLVPVADTKGKILKPHLERHISENVATIYSDGSAVYVFALNQKFAGKQKTIDHNKAYAIGDTHTQNIESAFSLFKKGLYGSFHHVSIKHIARYCNEFSYRFNRRHQQAEMFEQTIKGLLRGNPIRYKDLTASETMGS
jgi:hypothetical protein